MICNWIFWEKIWTMFLGIELAAYWSQFRRISLFWKGQSLPNILDLPSKVSHQTTNFLRNTIELSRRRYFTCCSTESGRGLRKFPSSNVIGRPATEAQFQSGGHFKEVDRDRVEKACLPYFGQSEMNIWKVQLSCGQRGLLKCALVG